MVFMNFDKVVSDVVGCGTLGVLVFIKSVFRMMVPSWGIWRTLSFPVWILVGQGHLLCHWWSYLPHQRYPESFEFICLLEGCQEWGVLYGVLGGHWEFLTGDLEDRVTCYVIDVIILPHRRYPESFVFIYLLEVCQEGGSFMEVLGGHWGFLNRDLEDRVILDVMDDLVLP